MGVVYKTGDLCLRDITALGADRFLSALSGTKLSHESIDKVRDVLSSVLDSAVRYELLVKNPVEDLTLPRRKTGKRSKPYITPEQFKALVEMIREPYASMVRIGVHRVAGE